jgi:hypothetical protein
MKEDSDKNVWYLSLCLLSIIVTRVCASKMIANYCFFFFLFN